MRFAIAVLLVVVLAGCSGFGGQASTDESVQTTGAATGTEDCTPDTLLTADGTDSTTPRPLPSRPEMDGPEAVGSFVRSYERAFAHNHELASSVRSIGVETQRATVREHGDGYHVRIHVWIETTHEGQNGTTTYESAYDAHYYVDDTTLRRTETERFDEPNTDIRNAGLTLSCWS